MSFWGGHVYQLPVAGLYKRKKLSNAKLISLKTLNQKQTSQRATIFQTNAPWLHHKSHSQLWSWDVPGITRKQHRVTSTFVSGPNATNPRRRWRNLIRTRAVEGTWVRTCCVHVPASRWGRRRPELQGAGRLVALWGASSRCTKQTPPWTPGGSILSRRYERKQQSELVFWGVWKAPETCPRAPSSPYANMEKKSWR